jgi:translation initiation factor IF-3
MVMVIGPHKNKADAKAEANAKRAANRARSPLNEAPKPSTGDAGKTAPAAEKTEEENA